MGGGSGKKCLFENCKLKGGGPNPSLRFKEIPSDPVIRANWMKIIWRVNGADWVPSDRSAVCSIHFLESDYVDVDNPDAKIRRLKKGVVPTVFPEHRSCTLSELKSINRKASPKKRGRRITRKPSISVGGAPSGSETSKTNMTGHSAFGPTRLDEDVIGSPIEDSSLDTHTTTSNNYFLDTKDRCFVCLGDIRHEFRGSTADSIHPFQHVTDHLQMDWKAMIQCDTNPTNCKNPEEKATLNVLLCDACAVVTKRFIDLSKKLEKIKKGMNSCLETIHEKMGECESDYLTVMQEVSKAWSNMNSESIDMIERVRKETLNKCTEFLNLDKPEPSKTTESYDDIRFNERLIERDDDLQNVKLVSNEADDTLYLMPISPPSARTPAPTTSVSTSPPKRKKRKLQSSTPITCLSCKVCGKLFETPLLFKTHFESKHVMKHHCVICKEKFSFKSQLTLHQKSRHKDLFPAIRPNGFQCDKCNLMFLTISAYEVHLKRGSCATNHRSNPLPVSTATVINLDNNDAVLGF